MRFQRQTRSEIKGVTPRRLVAAKKAVERDKESWALFPEYVKHNSPEERIQALDEHRQKFQDDWRTEHARRWRSARARLNKIAEPIRTELLQYWNRCGYPGSPSYLHSLIGKFESGLWLPALEKAASERSRMLGELFSDISVTGCVPKWENMPYREHFFASLHIARQIAQVRSPGLFEGAIYTDDPEDAYDVFGDLKTQIQSSFGKLLLRLGYTPV